MPRTLHEEAMTKPLLSAGATNASDAELARQVAKGDHAAFEALMRTYNRALFRTARAILRDDAEAEDALQEAYLKAYRTIGTYRARRGFQPGSLAWSQTKRSCACASTRGAARRHRAASAWRGRGAAQSNRGRQPG